ncbi:PREDICTED: two-component response regulator ORR26-like [Ipomoea nil]|uniref:two-component response regulator ORR26-like n=1 Tax=Ipomoea nil TaxID=35883 RepID=UPI0009015B98|nr:PREDICTED: two-component response regulator ORR26-like [Ipomoea nil]
MWRLPEYQIDNPYANISMASHHMVTNGIHVLVSDHDLKFLASTVDMLKRHFYKVTVVDCASAALSVLSQKEQKFDAVIANVNSPDMQGFKLLRQAVSMDLIVILLCDEEDAEMAVRLIEHGAFLLLQKPMCQETLKNLWQHVVRERNVQRGKEMMLMEKNNRELAVINNGGGGADRGKGVRVEENENYEMSYRGKGKRTRQQQSLNESTQMMMNPGLARVKRKTCTEWTVELHEKFMNAVHQLGDGRCYPKEILELMNVPGLTRMQVASHLQKCRNDNWKAPEERRAPPTSSVSPATESASRNEQRRFGTMPRLTAAVVAAAAAAAAGNSQTERQQLESTTLPEVQSSPSMDGAGRGDSSQTLVHRQYLTIGYAATHVSKLDSSSPPSVVRPVAASASAAVAVTTFNATSGQASIVGSFNYGSEGGLQGLSGGGGGSLFGNKDDFSADNPSNTTTGDDSYATPPPPRLRSLQSDEFLTYNDVDYEYLIQGFSDNNARQGGVGLQAPWLA